MFDVSKYQKLLTKDFSNSQSNMPFSIPILLPSGDYYVRSGDVPDSGCQRIGICRGSEPV